MRVLAEIKDMEQTKSQAGKVYINLGRLKAGKVTADMISEWADDSSVQKKSTYRLVLYVN